VVIFGNFFFDAIGRMADLQFYEAQRQDLTVAFREPRERSVRHALARLPGVAGVELFRSVPVRLRAAHRSRRVALNGLEPGASLRRIVDGEGRAHAAPRHGLLLTDVLARILAVSPGDTLEVEVLEGERQRLRLPVSGTVDELTGTAAYMEIGALGEALRDAGVASGADLRVAAGSLPAVYRALKRMPLVAGVTTPAAARESFRTQMSRSLRLSGTLILVMATLIALAVVYNGARIALSERGRELASLRVLGFTVHEVATILLGEQAVVTLLGIPLGFVIGPLWCLAATGGFSGEVYRIPFVIRAPTFVLAAGTVLAAAVLAALAVRRRLSRFDLIAVLKTRE
jgi:putative ABC transport system permease protein